jgi:predicted O-linked N-acetylglucosamine transferase (SPINDLY family)
MCEWLANGTESGAPALGLLAEMHAAAGRPDEALSTLQRLSHLKPQDAAVWRRLGHAELGRGEWVRAVESYRRAIGIEPDCARAHNNLGQALMRLESRAEAIASYRRAIQLEPGSATAHNNLGIALCEDGETEAALESYRRALALDSKLAEAHHNYGNALLRLERLQEALECYDRALELKPASVEALAGRGDALAGLKGFAEALATYQRALQLDPRSARLLGKAATVLLELKHPLQALSYRERALQQAPPSADVYRKRAVMLSMLSRFEESLECCQQALALQPDHAPAIASRAFALRKLHRYEEALAACEGALDLEPDFVEALCTRAEVLIAMGQQLAARDCMQRILELDPDRADTRVWALMNHIPLVPLSPEEVDVGRLMFAEALTGFEQWLELHPQVEPESVVGFATPFALAYQETTNVDLLTRHGRLCCDSMSRWQQRNAVPEWNVAACGSDKVRVGIVSAHVRDHSVYRALVKGWLGRLDRQRLEVGVVHLGDHQDGETLWAKRHADFFIDGVRSLHEWTQTINSLSLDVLVYPEIGMHRLTLQLASLRLARHQLAAWGHPETTGLPTVDYYLSARCFEPPQAQSYYSEKLVPLANLGCYYEPFGLSPVPFEPGRWGIDGKRPLLVCAGMPFKYAPQHDHLFPEIARRIGDCQFVFFTAPVPRLTDNLRERLRGAFRSHGLEPSDYLVFLPWQHPAEFFGLMRQASVLLDTLGFSGFNTIMQAIECDLPVVAFEGRFMRGRLGSGIMQRAGLPDLVARTVDEYIELAVRLATQDAFSRDVRRRMEQGKSRLFRDDTAIVDLAEFLVTANSAPATASRP